MGDPRAGDAGHDPGRGAADSARQILGLFEFVLGAALIMEPLDQALVIYFGAGIWAMLGGLILFSDALRQRSRTRGATLNKDG